MALKAEIEKTFKTYLGALFSQDYELLFSLLYEEDVHRFRNSILEFSVKMDKFGENQDFLQKLGYRSIEELESLSILQFMTAIFKLISSQIGKEGLNKMVGESLITNIIESDNYVEVEYQHPVFFMDEWLKHEGQLHMIKSKSQWKIFFKSGLEEGLQRFQKEIDDYQNRKEKDNFDSQNHEGDLIPFTLKGYKNFATGEIVIEPRFKDAGDFSNGLAPVQIMRKYGYINTRGDLAIKCQFIEAREFSQKLAAVKMKIDDGSELWGFINKKGKTKIDFQYENTGHFKNGLCPVKKGSKWAYINKKNEKITPFKFHNADSFNFGSAYAQIYNSKGLVIEYHIDKKGNITKMEE